MKDWSPGKAFQTGDDEGRKVSEYLLSSTNNIPKERYGFIILSAQPPDSEEIIKQYEYALAKHKINLEVCQSGDPSEVVGIVERLKNKHLD